jgi:hypothetical protein
MSRTPLRILAPAVLLLVRAAAVYAQDSGDAPKPAMAGDSISAFQSSAQADVPDTRPLAGVQNLSLGTQASSHSFLLPSFGVTSQVQVNPNNSTSLGNSSPASITYLTGRLALNKISTHSELLLDYLAGGGFSTYSTQGGNSVVQSLDFAETIKAGRWSQMFGEQFSYLPASAFNFGGLGGLGSFGVGLNSVGVSPGFRQDLIPNQSIVTNGADRISNSAITQTTYALGYRSSLSFYGTYGTLHFLNGGLQDNNTVSTGAGYNYLLSPLNSMSVSYGFGRISLSHFPVGIDSHSVQLSFARRITGRISFQFGAGPDVQIYRSPLAGSGTILSWGLTTGLNYQRQSWGTGFNYNHSLTGGSGVLPGAETDMVSGHAARTFGNWQATTIVGYSRNRGLEQTLINPIAPQTWYAGAQMSRRFVSFGSFFVSYNVSRQSSLVVVCSLPACQTGGVTQTVSVGYNWGFRPIILE